MIFQITNMNIYKVGDLKVLLITYLIYRQRERESFKEFWKVLEHSRNLYIVDIHSDNTY